MFDILMNGYFVYKRNTTFQLNLGFNHLFKLIKN